MAPEQGIQPDSDSTRSKSLKRARPDQLSSSPNTSAAGGGGLRGSPVLKSPRFGGHFSPAPLTGAAALADERRKKEEQKRNEAKATSENPTHKALSTLMAGGGMGMSRTQDAPTATTSMSEGMSIVGNAIATPTSMHFDERPENSPASVTSLASLNSTAQTATASSTTAASPAGMALQQENSARLDPALGAENTAPGGIEGHASANRALTFPGHPLAHQDLVRAQARNMSLPLSGLNQPLAPRSPGQKKHKCPYCETEFTRQHNLKSHLLTHSQEKPYICQTCSMRFRRLHDLKRHTKLHTGERPHICPKCDRKFARGDALARHSKGQGGCAGRRASMGSFGGDEDFDGSRADGGESMDGVIYDEPEQQNEEEMSEEERRRRSLPSIKAQHVSGSEGNRDQYPSQSRGPSTYPPAGPRPGTQSAGGLYPPAADRGASSSSSSMQSNGLGGHTPRTSASSVAMGAGNAGSMYSQGGITESPKPLSPTTGMHAQSQGPDSNRQRSPSLSTQFQQQQYARGSGGRGSPPNISLPSPHGTHGPKLPALSQLAPPEPRYTIPTQHSSQQSSPGGHQNTSGSHNQSVHQTDRNPAYQGQMSASRGNGPPIAPMGSSAGDNSNNLFASGERGVWTYIQSLEDKIKQMADKITTLESNERVHQDTVGRLTDELRNLRAILNNQSQSQPAQSQPQNGNTAS